MKKFKTLLPIFILAVFSFLNATSMDKIELSDSKCLLKDANEEKQKNNQKSRFFLLFLIDCHKNNLS